MDQQNKINIIRLRWQANSLANEIFFEEIKENPDIDVLNRLIKRIFRSWSTASVFENEKTYQNQETMMRDIDKKYIEYFYAFGRHLPKAVVKIEKLNY